MIYCNAAEPYQLYFQNSGSEFHKEILYLHDYILYYLILILVVTTWLMFTIMYKFNYPTYYLIRRELVSSLDMNHGTWIEILWTCFPGLILILIALPSFKVLYKMDSVMNPNLTVKVTGAQWYWIYDISDFTYEYPISIVFDSYMIPVESLKLGELRLMEVDNPLLLPVHKLTRFLVTSIDVIHSWSIPSLGIKLDAVPGRLNQIALEITRTGSFYGACQEICGVQHAFMPIKLNVVSFDEYVSYIIPDRITI